MNKKPTYSNGFLAVKEELCRRTKKPAGQFTFWMYIVIAVIMLGGVGIWYEVIVLANSLEKDTNALKMAFLTFSPAVIGASSLLILFEKKQSRELMAFSLLSLITVLFVFILLSVVNFFSGWLGLFSSFILSVVSVWVCWIANSDNTGLQDNIDPINSVGGNLDKSPEGTTEGWDL